jgi:hypothetical protein
MVNSFAAHLDTAKTLDSVGVIEEVMFVCAAEKPGQSSMQSPGLWPRLLVHRWAMR